MEFVIEKGVAFSVVTVSKGSQYKRRSHLGLAFVLMLRSLQRVRLANRGRFAPPDTWSCPILDLHLFLC